MKKIFHIGLQKQIYNKCASYMYDTCENIYKNALWNFAENMKASYIPYRRVNLG